MHDQMLYYSRLWNQVQLANNMQAYILDIYTWLHIEILNYSSSQTFKRLSTILLLEYWKNKHIQIFESCVVIYVKILLCWDSIIEVIIEFFNGKNGSAWLLNWELRVVREKGW